MGLFGGCNNNCNSCGGLFGGNDQWIWIIIIIVLALCCFDGNLIGGVNDCNNCCDNDCC